MRRVSRTDKLCLLTLALLWFGTAAAVELVDCTAKPIAEAEDKPAPEIVWEAPVNHPQLSETITRQLDPYREDIPLDRELQAALREACRASGVPIPLALGLIEVESSFQTDTVSSEGAYGLCQLNPKYFPADLPPGENIAAGVGYLGELLDKHETIEAALTAYNAGSDTGDRTYANAALAAAEKWRVLCH